MDDWAQDSVDVGSVPCTPKTSVTERGEGFGPVQAYTKEEHDDVQCRMNSEKRGRAIILNNKEFVCDKKTRTGTDVDASNVCARFKHLGFEVVRHNNKTGEQMKETITDVSALDFSSCDCLVCVILSYGEEGLIYGTEGPVQIKDFVDPFKRNKSLAGKPKLFFTNGAGMAAEYVNGVLFRRVETHIIPREADFLIAYSTVPGNLSWEGQG